MTHLVDRQDRGFRLPFTRVAVITVALIAIASSLFSGTTASAAVGAPDRAATSQPTGFERLFHPSPLYRLSAQRCGMREEPVTLVFPRGQVRVEDLDIHRIDVSGEFEGPARLVFRRGREVLHSEAFDPTNTKTERPFPRGLRSALTTGDCVSWSLVLPNGETSTAEFTVVRARTRSSAVTGAAHARQLLDVGLHYAAYRAAQRTLRAEPEQRQAAVVAQHALHRLDLRKTRVWVEACRRVMWKHQGR